MGPELLEIQPRELKFTFELKKQSLCSVQLVNNSDQYVAFKVKTTSPKRYCVRPNIGIIQPMSTCDFTVTMQAQRVAPPDMQCKDKFLIQSTVVPFGTTMEDITPSMFTKDGSKYIEENKLRVVLVSPPHSPVLLQINGALKHEPAYEAPILRDQVLCGVENLPPPHMKPAKDVEELKPANVLEELKPANVLEELKPAKDAEEPAKDVEELKPANVLEELKPAKDVEELQSAKDVEELQTAKDVEELQSAKDVVELKLVKDAEQLKLARDIEEYKSKINELDSKFSEAEITITRLRDERSTTTKETQILQEELAMLRRKSGVRVQVGFPFLFVCLVSLVSVALGYLLHL